MRLLIAYIQVSMLINYYITIGTHGQTKKPSTFSELFNRHRYDRHSHGGMQFCTSRTHAIFRVHSTDVWRTCVLRDCTHVNSHI